MMGDGTVRILGIVQACAFATRSELVKRQELPIAKLSPLFAQSSRHPGLTHHREAEEAVSSGDHGHHREDGVRAAAAGVAAGDSSAVGQQGVLGRLLEVCGGRAIFRTAEVRAAVIASPRKAQAHK